jgi:hypothetical protein
MTKSPIAIPRKTGNSCKGIKCLGQAIGKIKKSKNVRVYVILNLVTYSSGFSIFLQCIYKKIKGSIGT